MQGAYLADFMLIWITTSSICKKAFKHSRDYMWHWIKLSFQIFVLNQNKPNDYLLKGFDVITVLPTGLSS